MTGGAAARVQKSRADALRPAHSTFWIVSAVYFIVYMCINTITDSHQFVNSGITLWSPDNGLSLLLIMESPLFTPIVIVGNVFSDIVIHHVHNTLFTTIFIETALSLGYFFISILLRDVFHFDIAKINFDSVLALIAVLPATAAITMSLYCGILYLTGSVPRNMLSVAAYNFWLGDTVGMIVVIPATGALFDIITHERWRTEWKWADISWVSFLSICLFVSTFVSASGSENHYLFYVVFLPIIWVSIRYGYLGSALFLLATQVFVISAITYFHVDDDQFSVFQTLMFILSATGLLLGIVITERAQTERLLRDQRAELARVGAQAAAGAMASTVAHEISQPLSAMSIYVHSACLILDGGERTPSVAEARAALAEAEAQGKRTRAIIERVRDFVAGGKLLLESVDLGQLAQKIGRLSMEEAEDRGVAISIDFRSPFPLVRADRIAVEQALNNLVVNAVDSAAERGDSAGRVVIRLSQRDDRVLLEVDDNGAGVASEVADKLFEAFETTKSQGMGLGLPLARQVARRHCGHLTWQPLDPRGARFTIDLPMNGPE